MAVEGEDVRMSGEDAPEPLSSIPSRPLTSQEAEQLPKQRSGTSWVRSESEIMPEDQRVVVALTVINEERGTRYLVGFSPESEAWEVVETWDEAEPDPAEFSARLEAWEEANHKSLARFWDG